MFQSESSTTSTIKLLLSKLQSATGWQKFSLALCFMGCVFFGLSMVLYWSERGQKALPFESEGGVELSGGFSESSIAVTTSTTPDVSSSTPSAKMIQIDVSGAVQHPGIYALPEGSRVGEAVALAGGLTKTADLQYVHKNLNLAVRLKDESKIYLPFEGEELLENVIESAEEKGDQASDAINVNTASETELRSLEGIGEARARTIIEQRPYLNLEELQQKTKIPGSVLSKLAGILAY